MSHEHFWNHNFDPWENAPPWALELRGMLGIIKGAIMVDLTALIANEIKLVADVATLKAANVQAAADLKTAQDALAAALAANDPAAAAAAQAQIDTVAKALADADATIAPPVAVGGSVPNPIPDTPAA